MNSNTNQVIKVSGEKLECLVLAEGAIQLMCKLVASIDEFNELWNKKLTLVTKNEIIYEDIKSISKEEGEEQILIKSKLALGIPGETNVTFDNPEDRESFYHFFQTEKGFIRTDDTLSPFKSAMPYIGGLALSLGATTFGYYRSLQMVGGELSDPEGHSRSDRRERMLNSIIETLGSNGILALGLSISAYIAYKIWDRYKNPPVQTKLVPGG